MTKSKARYIRLPRPKRVFRYMAPICEHCGVLAHTSYAMRKTGYERRPDVIVDWCEKCAEGPDAEAYEKEGSDG